MSEDNAEQIEHWNGEGGERWVEGQARMDAVLAPHSRLLLEHAAPRTGERVLDVGCGCGDTSLDAADRGADVLGVDISAPMLARARERAAGRERLRFVHGDAADHPFDAASFDVVLSRFGVMFFADSVQAFTNLRRATARGGRLCFVCWQAAARNPWLVLPMQALAPLAPDLEPFVADGPGPFAFAEPERVTGILHAAGWRDVTMEPHEVPLRCGRDLDDALELVVRLGPASRVLNVLPPAQHPAAYDALRRALQPFETAEGVMLGSASFVVTARA